MLLYEKQEKNGLLIRKEVTSLTTPEIAADVKTKSNMLQQSGVLCSHFDSDIWLLTNEKKKISLKFNYRALELEQICESKQKYRKLIQMIKYFTMLRLQTLSLDKIQDDLRYCINELVRSEIGNDCEAIPHIEGDRGQSLIPYIDFIRAAGIGTEEYKAMCKNTLNVYHTMAAETSRTRDHPVVLNEFQSYFHFDSVLRDFWTNNTNQKLRAFYFPLYLYWTITTVLPLRVTEFCVTPYNCISTMDGKHYLTIRRTRLKGSSSLTPKIHYYHIDQDYIEHTYEIPKWLYDLIEEYREMVAEYSHPYDTLFSIEALTSLNYRPLKCKNKNIVFNNIVLTELITYFYQEIVCKKYGYILVASSYIMDRMKSSGSYELEDNEIMQIQAKHTRHLALINLILRGANPMIIKEFAGHAEDATSSHYYSNVSQLVRCRTKYLYEKARNENSNMASYVGTGNVLNPLSIMIDRSRPHIAVDGGWCYSANFLAGESGDCIACYGKCDSCSYFIPDLDNRRKIDEKIDQMSVSTDAELKLLRKLLSSPDIESRLNEYTREMQQLECDISNLAMKYWQKYQAESEEVMK